MFATVPVENSVVGPRGRVGVSNRQTRSPTLFSPSHAPQRAREAEYLHDARAHGCSQTAVR